MVTEIKDLNTFFRYLYPGIILVFYMYLRWFNESFNSNFFFYAIVLVLISGVALYPPYRFIWYDYVLRWIEAKFKGYPQYVFHCNMLDELSKEADVDGKKRFEKMKDMRMASAFQSNLLNLDASTDFRTENTRFNSTVHVLFITGFIGLLIFLMELIIPPISSKLTIFPTLIDSAKSKDFSLIWLITSSLALIIMTVMGIIADRQADLRELVFLIAHKEKYNARLVEYHKAKLNL